MSYYVIAGRNDIIPRNHIMDKFLGAYILCIYFALFTKRVSIDFLTFLFYLDKNILNNK